LELFIPDLITEKMNLTDLKIYLLNTSVLALNFTNIELGLKIILTIVAIGYTATKWWLMIKENKNG
jgi:hypothetical protein